MCILLKDLTKGQMSKEWLNRLIKETPDDTFPKEKGEIDREMERPKDSYLPKHRKGGK